MYQIWDVTHSCNCDGMFPQTTDKPRTRVNACERVPRRRFVRGDDDAMAMQLMEKGPKGKGSGQYGASGLYYGHGAHDAAAFSLAFLDSGLLEPLNPLADIE